MIEVYEETVESEYELLYESCDLDLSDPPAVMRLPAGQGVDVSVGPSGDPPIRASADWVRVWTRTSGSSRDCDSPRSGQVLTPYRVSESYLTYRMISVSGRLDQQ